jgi:hypothetical protein
MGILEIIEGLGIFAIIFGLLIAISPLMCWVQLSKIRRILESLAWRDQPPPYQSGCDDD